MGLSTTTSPFSFVGTLIADSTYRSNETIGTSTTTVDPNNAGAAPNAGYGGAVNFSSVDVVPEPSAYVFMGLGAFALAGLNRFRARRA